MKKQTYIYRSFERFWHWSQMLLIFFLILTGFEIHSSYTVFGFESAVKWHNIAAWAFLVLIIFAIFWHFVTGEWKQYIPTVKYLKEQVQFYISGIFKGAPHPTNKTRYNKLNPLQRLTYLGLKLLVIPVQVITGFIYMYYIYPNNQFNIGGIEGIAIIHTAGAFALMVFIVVHVYLTTTGHTVTASISAMITGWEVVDVDEKEEHIKHMQEAVDKSSAGYYQLDKNGIFVDTNEAWLKLYGYKNRDEIIGKHFSTTRDKKNLKELEDFVAKVLKGEKIIGKPVVRKGKDGVSGKHILSANPVEENGEIIGIEGFILDITNLSENTEQIHSAIKNSNAGYYRINRKGYFVDVNRAWLDMYKLDSEDEIIGRHFSLCRDSKDLKTLQDIVDMVMAGKTISNRVATRKCKDDSIGKHILSANPIYENDEIVGMEGFILDITSLDT